MRVRSTPIATPPPRKSSSSEDTQCAAFSTVVLASPSSQEGSETAGAGELHGNGVLCMPSQIQLSDVVMSRGGGRKRNTAYSFFFPKKKGPALRLLERELGLC